MNLPLLPLVLADVPPGLRLALAQEGVASVAWEPGPQRGRFLLFDSRRRQPPALVAGQVAIDADPLRSACAVDPFSSLMDQSACRRGWTLGGLHVTERVARHDKRAIRRRTMAALQARIEAAGGVWLRLSPVPAGYRTAFSFRLDHDDYDAADFAAVLAAIAGHEEATTHYVCASTHAPHPEALARLRGFDVGSHGFWHHTFRDPEENFRNIRRGIEALGNRGLEPRGFAAPHGRYPPALGQALAALGVTHSSEFALAYDDWPFWPEHSDALQLPIHPVCLGIALEAAAAQGESRRPAPQAVADSLAEHFCQAVVWGRESGEPVFLYGHPDRRLGRFPHVLRATLEAADQPDVWRTSHSRFAAWWQARNSVRWRVEGRREQFSIVVEAGPTDWPLAVEVWRGETVAVVPVVARPCVTGACGRVPARRGESPGSVAIKVAVDQLSFERRPPHALPRGTPVAERRSVRQRARDALDWERATPLDEISTRTWRGWLKRSLRQVRG